MQNKNPLGSLPVRFLLIVITDELIAQHVIDKYGNPYQGRAFSKIYMVIKIWQLTLSILGNAQFLPRLIIN